MVKHEERFLSLWLYLLMIPFWVLVIGALSLSAGEVKVPLSPSWSVGDWWTIDCAVFDDAGVVAGGKPGWRPPQGWYFSVENIEALEGDDHFIVLVKPSDGNACPYSFRYWFRASDLYVSRLDMIHPKSDRGFAFNIETVTKNYTGAPPAPYSISEFPSLPLAVPIFTNSPKSVGDSPKSITVGHPAAYAGTSQTSESVLSDAILDTKAQAMIPDAVKRNFLSGEAVRIRIARGAGVVDTQYWSSTLPWCVYGEGKDGETLTRRYWLTDAGKR